MQEGITRQNNAWYWQPFILNMGQFLAYIWPRAGWRTFSVDASRHSIFHPATKLTFIVKASVSNKDGVKVPAEVSRSGLFNSDVLQLTDHFRTWNCEAVDPAKHATINFHRLQDEKISHWQNRSVAWELIPFSPLSRRGLNPIKPVHEPHQPDGRLLFIFADARP